MPRRHASPHRPADAVVRTPYRGQAFRAVTTLAASAAVVLPVVVGEPLTGQAGSVDDLRPVAAAMGRTPEQVLAAMTLRQKVGQLFMVGTPATYADARTARQIGTYHVGNVMLTGRSYSGTATPARVAGAMQARTTAAATARVRLLVATDQEGGLVQVLNGGTISDLPSALVQGTWHPTTLRTRAGTWARQLRRAGVNMNLAPVVDTVPSPSAARDNPPIGALQRNFGYTTQVVGNHGRAFALGMADGGVVATVKHFPGLGRVHANTDTTSGVTDHLTTRHDAYLAPFATAIAAGVPVVMMSTAYYARIDRANPAAFSSTVITSLLRGDLGFDGVVISDDLANARQTARWTPGQRAVKFLRAGGDLVLTVNPATLPAMYGAVLDRARGNAEFRAAVNRKALRVLSLKAAQGLLGS